MRRTADVVIVGGGVMGASIARALVERGVSDVLLLERRFLAAGSTGKSGAIIRQHYSTPLGAEMARRSLEVFRGFRERFDADCGWTQTGMLLLAPGADREALHVNLRMQQGLGIRTASLDYDDIARIAPDLDLHDDVVACYEPDAGFADAVRTTRAFAEAARRGGAAIREGDAVRSLRLHAGRCIGVETTDGPVDAGAVVLAAGPWSAALARTVGLDIPAHAARVQVALLRPALEAAAGPVVIDFANEIYFKPWAGRVVQVGSIDSREGESRADPDQYPQTADPDFLSHVGAAAARRTHALRNAIPFGGFSALYTVTPDWYPILGFAPEVDGLLLVTGFSGHGFKLSPIIGDMAADLLTGHTPALDPTPLRPTRFAEGDLIRSPYAYNVMG